MGRRSQVEFNRFLAQLQEARNLQIGRLTRDYLPVAQDLRTRYESLLPSIEAAANRHAENGRMQDLLTTIRRDLSNLNREIESAASGLQTVGVRQGYDLGLQALNAGGVAVRFNQPTLEAILNSVDYVGSDAYETVLNSYAPYHAEQVRTLIVQGVAEGKNPKQIASEIYRYFADSTSAARSDIERLTRTTMIYSARRATGEIYQRTGVSEWIWSANLGNPRTCLMCVCQHGTVHSLEKEPYLNDHHSGRCAMMPVTPKWADLGFDSGGNPKYQTGVDWLMKQPADVQQQMMGKELFEAYQNGNFKLSADAVTTTYHNPIFGEMRRRKPNDQILVRS